MSALIATLLWREMDLILDALCDKIVASGYRPQAIVGIERSGLVPAVCLSHLLGVRDFYSILIQRTLTDDRSAPKIPPIVGSVDQLQIGGKSVLLVDDVVHTGETMKTGMEILIGRGATEVKCVTLVERHTDPALAVDFAGVFSPYWVDFPWNRHYDARRIHTEVPLPPLAGKEVLGGSA